MLIPFRNFLPYVLWSVFSIFFSRFKVIYGNWPRPLSTCNGCANYRKGRSSNDRLFIYLFAKCDVWIETIFWSKAKYAGFENLRIYRNITLKLSMIQLKLVGWFIWQLWIFMLRWIYLKNANYIRYKYLWHDLLKHIKRGQISTFETIGHD